MSCQPLRPDPLSRDGPRRRQLHSPSTLALLTTSFPPGPERTRAIGFYGATAGIGASLGLVVGGVLTDLLSWRAVQPILPLRLFRSREREGGTPAACSSWVGC
jgi:Major Facilitator Superfamily